MNLVQQTKQIYFTSRDNNLRHVKRQAMKRWLRWMPAEKKKALLTRAGHR